MAGTLALVALASPLAAQTPPSGCVDPSGATVETIVDNNLGGWAGTATIENGKPVIYWNTHNNAGASQATRVFIYLHECAHHMLGHIWGSDSPRKERQADCWAIQLMIESGMARAKHIALVEREARQTRRDDNHLGGDDRVRSLRSCVAVKTDRRAWAAALDALVRASRDSFRSIEGDAWPRPDRPSDVHWSTLEVAGTYDCTIQPSRALRCPVFAARDDKRVLKRFGELDKIISTWLPGTWAVRRQAASTDTDLARLHAADPATGAALDLEATRTDRILFTFTPAL